MAIVTNHDTFIGVAITTVLILFVHNVLAEPAPHAGTGPHKDLCKDSPFVGVCRAQIGSLADPVQAWKASVKTLLKNTVNAKKTSKKLGETSEVCNQNYDDAEDELHTALAAYDKRDKGTVCTYLSAALSDYTTCEDSWEEVPGAGKPLLLYNKVLHRMAANCLYFEKLLPY